MHITPSVKVHIYTSWAIEQIFKNIICDNEDYAVAKKIAYSPNYWAGNFAHLAHDLLSIFNPACEGFYDQLPVLDEQSVTHLNSIIKLLNDHNFKVSTNDCKVLDIFDVLYTLTPDCPGQYYRYGHFNDDFYGLIFEEINSSKDPEVLNILSRNDISDLIDSVVAIFSIIYKTIATNVFATFISQNEYKTSCVFISYMLDKDTVAFIVFD